MNPIKPGSVRRAVALGAVAWAALACATSSPPSPARSSADRRGRVAALEPVEEQLIARAVESVAATWPDSTALCLALLGGPAGPELPGPALLASLRTRQRPVSSAACPRTYTSMIAHVDSLGYPDDPPPPGYVDPYILEVGRPQFESDSYGWIHVREWQGTTGRQYLCTVQYVRGQASAVCQKISEWIS